MCIPLKPVFSRHKGDGVQITEPTGNLDSRTTVEVMGLLKNSSRKYNQTILMVTHNEAIAQTCDRIIRIEDGQIVSGSRSSGEESGQMAGSGYNLEEEAGQMAGSGYNPEEEAGQITGDGYGPELEGGERK